MENLTLEQRQSQDMIYALAASPNFAHDSLCFAARASGLYGSKDGGATWPSAYAELKLGVPLTTTAVAISPDFKSDHSVFAGVKGGILRSNDGGENWNLAILPSPPPLISALVVSPNFGDDGIILAGTAEDGFLCSVDRGIHWSAWNFGLIDLNVLAVAASPHFASDETIFIGTESGLFRSTNGGRAWRDTGFLSDYAPVGSLSVSPDYPDRGVILAGTEISGLFCSFDRGQQWVVSGIRTR